MGEVGGEKNAGWKDWFPALKMSSALRSMLGTEARGGDGTRNSRNKPTAAPHPFLSLAFPYSLLKMRFVALVGYSAGKKLRVTMDFFFSLPKHFQYK